MWKLRTFEQQKSILYNEKALEKLHSKMIFPKKSTETLTSDNPKTLKLTLKHGMSRKKISILMTYYISLKRS